MRHLTTIIKKELKTYFNSAMAYIVIIVFLIVSAWFFFRTFFFIAQASMRDFFVYLPWIFLFLIPAITMRLWAEERKSKTTEVLLTLPLRDWEVVIGKYFAALIFLLINLILSLPLALIVNALGQPDWGVIIGSYLGALFLGGAYLAIGLFISGLTDNQIVAFIITLAICFVLFIIGEDFVLYTLPVWLASLFRYLGLGAHFSSLSRGVIDTRDLIYYLSIIGFGLYLNIKYLSKRAI